jgi:hypothetical protein
MLLLLPSAPGCCCGAEQQEGQLQLLLEMSKM